MAMAFSSVFLLEEHAQVGTRDITIDTSIGVSSMLNFSRVLNNGEGLALAENDFKTGIDHLHFIAIAVYLSIIFSRSLEDL